MPFSLPFLSLPRRYGATLGLLISVTLGLNCNKSSADSRSWQTVGNGFAGPLQSIAFIDASNGLVIGPTIGTSDLRTILVRTTNGGLQWTVDTCTAPNFSIHTVQAFNGVYYAMGSSSTAPSVVQQSLDTGKTWQPLGVHTSGPVYFFNASNGILADSGALLMTTDGARNATPVYTAPPNSLLFAQVQFVDSGVGYAGAKDRFFPMQQAVMMKTVDSGRHWQQMPFPSGGLLNFNFLNRDTGFAFRYPNVVNRTVDGGETWTSVGTMPSGPFTDILKQGWFRNMAEAYALISNDLYYSSDSGRTWRIQYHNQTISRFSLVQLYVAPRDSTLFVIGDRGEIVRQPR